MPPSARSVSVTAGLKWAPETAAKAIANVKFDKVVVWDGGTGSNGKNATAGFLHGLTRGRSLAECGRLGSVAAAEVISHVGPRPLVELRTLVV